MSSEYVSLEQIVEDPVAKIKAILGELDFAKINEGEEVYLGSDSWACVIPYRDEIHLEGTQQLYHRHRVYVNVLRGAGQASLKDLRGISQQTYNKLMEDQSLDNTCWRFLPVSWRPGFFSQGDYNFVGVQMGWDVCNYQTIPYPTAVGATYTSMEDVQEKIVASMKAIAKQSAVDDVSEGEHPYLEESTVAWVIPGLDNVKPLGRNRLEHTMAIYQDLLTSRTGVSLASLRAIGEEIYDNLMVDITHGGICQFCIPRIWWPGFMTFGQQNFVGIEALWEAHLLQGYTPAG